MRIYPHGSTRDCFSIVYSFPSIILDLPFRWLFKKNFFPHRSNSSREIDKNIKFIEICKHKQFIIEYANGTSECMSVQNRSPKSCLFNSSAIKFEELKYCWELSNKLYFPCKIIRLKFSSKLLLQLDVGITASFDEFWWFQFHWIDIHELQQIQLYY